jgi:hypothetical protein
VPGQPLKHIKLTGSWSVSRQMGHEIESRKSSRMKGDSARGPLKLARSIEALLQGELGTDVIMLPIALRASTSSPNPGRGGAMGIAAQRGSEGLIRCYA